MRLAAIVLCLLLAAPAAMAQTASLLADRIYIEADARLIAEGNVEVISGDTKLTAERVLYDREADRLQIDGPIRLSEAGGTVILASAAELDASLERGILQSARLVLNRQLQLAAAELTRVSGRYTRLARVVASSCRICEQGETPLWEIRAQRVIRDEVEQQLYFDGAQLRMGGVPIFYLPRLRLPDPSLDRSTGFLPPRIRTRSQLSTGVVIPYFVRLGDHADVTLTPYLSSATTTLEFGYRQRFANGEIDLEGAVSRDDIREDSTRAYLFADGRFWLPNDFVFLFDLELVSDDSYLFDYDYSEADRLESSINLVRTRDDQLLNTGFTVYETLRASELDIERELPSEILEFDLRQRIYEDPAWGTFWGVIDAAAVQRSSSEDEVGRDVARLGFGMAWTASHTLPLGMVADAEAEIGLDLYGVNEDENFDDQLTRGRQAIAAGLRWPFERTEESGARHLLEPLVQLAWADTNGDEVPNEDSTDVEFDEGNLLSLSRFPGVDRIEEGLRLNLGVAWTRYDPTGWSLGATAGRIYRLDESDQFEEDTGLSGDASDWLLALHYRLDDRFLVTTRSILKDDLDISQSETRFAWTSEEVEFSGSHLWRDANPLDADSEDISELSLDGSFQVSRFWRASTSWRFDAADGETTRAGVGLTFENECIQVGVSLSRRFTSSSTVEPATDLDLRVALTGLGTGGDRHAARRNCTG